MPTSPPPANATRDRIVETAFRLFLTQGYDRTSTAQLVAATGLSKGAIYHHFRDKEEIRAATIDHFLLRYLAPPARVGGDGEGDRNPDEGDRNPDEGDRNPDEGDRSGGGGDPGRGDGDRGRGDGDGDGSGGDRSRPALDLAAMLRHVADAYASLLETVMGITDDPLAYHRFVLAAAPGLRDPVRVASERLRDALTDAALASQRAGTITSAVPARQIAEGAAAVVEGAGLLWSLDQRGPVRERLRSIVDDHLVLLATPRGT